jgi:hypothetical protein
MFEISTNSDITFDPDWGNSITPIDSAFRVEVFSPDLEPNSMWFFYLLLPSIDSYESIEDEESLAFSVCGSFLSEDDHINIFRVDNDSRFSGIDKTVSILTFDPNNLMRYIWLKPPKSFAC